MTRLVTLTLTCALALAAGSAFAQNSFPISVTVQGGATLPITEARKAMGAGWNVGVAGQADVAGQLGVRADYLYSRFAAGTSTWDVTLGPLLPAFMEVEVRGKSQMHTGSFDLTWTWPLAQGARATVMAGPSIFHRRVQITGTGPHGDTVACEPLWFQCSAAAVPFDEAVGIKTSNDLGFNVGVGLAFPVGLQALLTVEARYFFAHGPEYAAPGGGTRRASANFLPVSVGLSF